MTRWRVTNLRKHLQYFRYTTDRRDAEMPSSAVGDSVLIVNIVLTIVGSNPSAEWDWFFPLFFDIADQIEKNFQGNIAFTLSDM